MDPFRVLIVEDNADARYMLKALLELEGYEVETAATGRRGLELIEFQRPDVALVDIGLPDIDGFELARRVRAQTQNDGVLLAALTGFVQQEDRRESLSAGFDMHLAKPLDPVALARILAERRQQALADHRGKPRTSRTS